MLQSHEKRVAACFDNPKDECCTCCSYPQCVLYNEIVINAKIWDQSMPSGLEAIAVPAHASPTAWRIARAVHYHLTDRCEGRRATPTLFPRSRLADDRWIPLLRLNVSRCVAPSLPPAVLPPRDHRMATA